ncbi:MFS transporter [Humibacter sp.]|uniref:MFS transporter n=1 Tax=Humibacter sp. TaxID=1940291 RepID=UPI003F7DEA89
MYDTLHSRRAPTPELRNARIAVFAVFASAGFLVGMWSGTIPLVAKGAGLSAGGLGVVILISSVGIVAGAQVGGRVQGRAGSMVLCIVGIVTAAFGVLAMGFAGDAGVLACAMTIVSFGMGLNDVGMNLQAVIVERAYRRPIMSAFHAFFSLGGVAGALAVLGTAALRWTVRPQLGFAALLCTIAVCVAGGWLVRPAAEADAATSAGAQTSTGAASAAPAPSEARKVLAGPAGWPEFAGDVAALTTRPPRVRVRWTRVAVMLGASALLLMFAEGVATDWSALQLTQAFGAAAGVSAFGYGAFSVAMTGGRLVVDRVVAALGPVVVVRGGALLGVLGLGAVLLAPSLWVALAGWALLGVGLCGCVPQVFSAAGNQPHSAVVLSRVLTFGYVGIFGGPALIGLIANATSVTVALLAPFAALVLAALLAVSVRALELGAEAISGLRRDASANRRLGGRSDPAPRTAERG